MPRSYSIIAGTLYGNRGAQAMTETVVGRLRDHDPAIGFSVFSYYPDDDRRVLVDPSIAIHSATPAALVLRLLPLSLLFGLLRRVLGRRVLSLAPADIRALGTSTALVDVAGVSFIDGREKYLPFNVLTLVPAMLLGVPVVKMSQATGPFGSRANRLASRLVLPRVRMIWARGAGTKQHLDDSGLRGLTYAQADDIAFVHSSSYALTREGGTALDGLLATVAGSGSSVVGVCPSSVIAVRSRAEGGSYETVLAGLVRDLSAAGHQVVLFPNATRAGDRDGERNNDLPVIRRVLAGAGAGPVAGPVPVSVDMDIDASAVKRVIQACDLVVVSRFHAMVGALSLAVPVVVLGWSHKYAEVMARFGMQDQVSDYRRLSGPELRLAVESAIARRTELTAAIRAQLPEVLHGAEKPLLGLLEPQLGAEAARG